MDIMFTGFYYGKQGEDCNAYFKSRAKRNNVRYLCFDGKPQTARRPRKKASSLRVALAPPLSLKARRTKKKPGVPESPSPEDHASLLASIP